MGVNSTWVEGLRSRRWHPSYLNKDLWKHFPLKKILFTSVFPLKMKNHRIDGRMNQNLHTGKPCFFYL
jgi:hypothetical protein